MGKPKKKGFLKETLETIVSALVLALFIRAFFIQVFFIPSGSMEPTLNVSDRIIVNKITEGIVNPLHFLDINETILGIPNGFYKSNSAPLTPRHLLNFTKPHREDVVVFRYPNGEMGTPGKDFIKRIIGLPGETLKIRNGTIYINGKLLKENHLLFKDDANFGPVKIPADSYFVMGDNRPNSADSRYWGFLPEKFMIGKAFIIIWPLNRIGFIPKS